MADVFAVGLHTFGDGGYAPHLHKVNGTWVAGSGLEIGTGSTGLLSLLSVIGTSLSIVGVVLTFITYSLFSDLRTLSGTSLLNLLAAFFLSHLLSVIGVERPSDKRLCVTLGFLLHFLWLAVHCWLAAMSRDMYKTFRDNINLQPSPASEDRKSFLKAAAFAWGLPLLLTGLSGVVHFGTVLDQTSDDRITCWILGRGSYLWTFCLPAFVLAVSDVRYFVKAAILTRYTASLQMNRKTRDRMKRRRYLQLFLYAKLLLVLTLTWVAGLAAQLARLKAVWFAFCILASVQGFFVALAYSCNSRVFRLYSRSLRSGNNNRKGYGASDLSGSTDLALLTWEPTPDAV